MAQYVFDGAKRLVVRKKYASGSLSQTRHFYHTAGWQTIEERLESGGSILATADRQFTWGLRYIDDLVCRTVNSVHDYAYQDPNWNVILSSATLARVVYEPYGQIRSTCPAASGDLDAWQHYFAGYRRDEDTGLYLVRHRVYQPELGCWVQRDPIGYRGSRWNLSEYAGSQPISQIDPNGEACLVYYNCFYISQARLDWNTVRCNYRCLIDTTRGGENGDPPGTKTAAVGGVSCQDPDIKNVHVTGWFVNKMDFHGEADCEATTTATKAWDHCDNPFTNCSRSKCKNDAKASLKALKSTCKLAGPLQPVCKALIAVEEQALKELCDNCDKP